MGRRGREENHENPGDGRRAEQGRTGSQSLSLFPCHLQALSSVLPRHQIQSFPPPLGGLRCHLAGGVAETWIGWWLPMGVRGGVWIQLGSV